jgi:hypothetical protein
VFLTKKWGILIKKESESLDFTGLEIPREYTNSGRLKEHDFIMSLQPPYFCFESFSTLEVRLIL